MLPHEPVAALSGPSHAEEVARGTPTAVVASSLHPELAGLVQRAFMTDRFRIYTGDDLVGVELGGALKNVIAIAAGITDGLGLGDNAKAALVTRGQAEMSRLGMAFGARQETFFGLSGMGDLMVTCFSKWSRNRGVGERLGRGETLDQILASMEMVAEGVRTANSAVSLSQKTGIEVPITREVVAVLYQGKSPRDQLCGPGNSLGFRSLRRGRLHDDQYRAMWREYQGSAVTAGARCAALCAGCGHHRLWLCRTGRNQHDQHRTLFFASGRVFFAGSYLHNLPVW